MKIDSASLTLTNKAFLELEVFRKKKIVFVALGRTSYISNKNKERAFDRAQFQIRDIFSANNRYLK